MPTTRWFASSTQPRMCRAAGADASITPSIAANFSGWCLATPLADQSPVRSDPVEATAARPSAIVMVARANASWRRFSR